MKADREQVSRLIKTAKGQLEGILKMVEEDRYCIDISQQLMATQAILKKVNTKILAAHLSSCVINAETQAQKEEKVEELIGLIGKVL